MEQPRALVEVVPPDFDHVYVPTDARASMNAVRALVLAMRACRFGPAARFQASAHAPGDGAAADADGARANQTATRASADRTFTRYVGASRRVFGNALDAPVACEWSSA
jgi:hypothetical protein